jgi:superfamily II DNA or RNA helicase
MADITAGERPKPETLMQRAGMLQAGLVPPGVPGESCRQRVDLVRQKAQHRRWDRLAGAKSEAWVPDGDEGRNELIFNDVLASLDAGRSPVVITERTDHLEALADRLSRFPKNVIVLRGGQSERKRREAMERLAVIPEQDERVIVATGRYLGEGFDDQRLDTLFLTMPIAWRGTLAQYAGRLHRLHDPKREVVTYDYVDRDVPVLARMAAKRAAGYSAIGYTTTHGPGFFDR